MSDKEESKRGIYNGNRFWDRDILDGLIKMSVEGREYYRYQYAPDSLYESLLRAQKRFPQKPCLVDNDGMTYTYSEFLELTDRFSRELYHLYHVRPGMQVGILLYNSPEFCISVYALSRLGAVAVPLSTKYRRPEVESLIEKSDIKGVLFHRDYAKWMEDIPSGTFRICMNMEEIHRLVHMPEIPEITMKANDAAFLMFTSGTTSRSKGVLLKNYNVMHGIEVYRKIFRISETDVTILPVPGYHVTGLLALLGLFICAGGCVRLHKFFDAQRVLREMKENHVTFLHASPTVYSMLLEKKKQYPYLPDVRIMACGSGNMPKKKMEEIRKWMPQVQFCTVYGLTETSSPATVFPGNAAESSHIGSSGHPIPGVEFKICNEDGAILPSGSPGNILVRGTNVIEAYYGRERNTGTEHWLDTGDIGYFDRDGYLYITDRRKDMINRGGEKICSYDVENALYEIPGVKEAAVVGIPDERYGEVPAAMIVGKEKSCPTEEEIRTALKEKLAKFQIPIKYVFRTELPVTANMKTDKKEIRRIIAEDKEEESK